MLEMKCPDCDSNIGIPQDSITGEIISCPDCGLEFEVKKADNGDIELVELIIEGEDWGE